MNQQKQPLTSPLWANVSRTAVFRTIWLLVATGVLGLIVAATPLRYQMLLADVYGYGQGLADLGLSLRFFAIYFTSWELLLIVGLLIPSSLIIWQRTADWFAYFVAITLLLLGLLPPLADGLSYANPAWATPLSILRILAFSFLLTFVCLFPNGRFVPRWTRWLLLLWLCYVAGLLSFQADVLTDTAILPNTRTAADALWLIYSISWFVAALVAQGIRYRRYTTSGEKQQVKWVLIGLILMVMVSLLIALILVSFPQLNQTPAGQALFTIVFGPLYLLATLILPINIAFSMLRFRLWDVDVVLNRTLVYGGLTTLITAVYALLVGTAGTLAFDSRSNTAAFGVATLIILIGIRPFYGWLQGQANRLVPLPVQKVQPLNKWSRISNLGWQPLLRAAWIVSALLLLLLFGAGLLVQVENGFWRLPALTALDNVPILIGILDQESLFLNDAIYPYALLASYLQAAVFLIVGLFLFWQKGNSVMGMVASWLLIAIGLGFTPTIVFLPLLEPAWHIPATIYQMSLFGTAFLFLALFPNGRFFPRWSRTAIVLWFGYLLLWFPFPQLNLHRSASIEPVLLFASVVALGLLFQLWRYRQQSNLEEKQQTKWVIMGFAGANAGLFCIACLLIWQPAAFLTSGLVLLGLAPILIPITITVALLRHRLWQIDLIISRTFVYGGLTMLITAVYALLVGGVGSLAGGGQSRLTAFVIATLIISLGIRPLFRWLQTAASRLFPLSTPTINPAPLLSTFKETQKNPPSRWVRLAQLSWLVNLLLVLILFAVGYQALFSQGISQLGDNITQLNIDPVFPRFLVERAQISPLVAIQMLIQATIFSLVGLFIVWKKPNNLVALLTSSMLLNIGLGFTPNLLFLPFVRPQFTSPYVLWQVLLYWTGILVFYLFPNGRLTSPRARWPLLISLSYIFLWLPFSQLTSGLATVWWPTLVIVGMGAVGIGNQVVRFRQSSPAEKAQIKWIIIGFCFANVGLLLLVLQPFLFPPDPFTASYRLFQFFTLLFGLAAVFIPISLLIALLRHDLWNVDFIINRTLVYGGLTAVILLAYALLVGGLSLLWQAQNNLLISLLATGLIAVLFQPVRERLQRGANRLMFGERDDPYAVLSKLGGQLQTNATPETMLQAVVTTVATTLKLPYVAIELVGEGGRLPSASTGKPVAETADFPLRYQNETVGFLVVSPRSPGEPFRGREQQLLIDIAGQAGAAAYSVRLTTALQKSREKLVLTREEERRRIRRDLHDELGPTLASQTFALDAALDLLESDPLAAADLLRSLKAQNKATVADIRRLVYELRPPSLDELGLAGALGAHIAHLNDRAALTIDLTAQPNPLPPLSAAVEVAAYRIALEGINNVVRHASATRCGVDLLLENGRSALQLTLTDNGIGLPEVVQKGVGLNSMRERAEELGGTLELQRLEQGTRITAVLPLAG